jgi:hypothetical protein
MYDTYLTQFLPATATVTIDAGDVSHDQLHTFIRHQWNSDHNMTSTDSSKQNNSFNSWLIRVGLNRPSVAQTVNRKPSTNKPGSIDWVRLIHERANDIPLHIRCTLPQLDDDDTIEHTPLTGAYYIATRDYARALTDEQHTAGRTDHVLMKIKQQLRHLLPHMRVRRTHVQNKSKFDDEKRHLGMRAATTRKVATPKQCTPLVTRTRRLYKQRLMTAGEQWKEHDVPHSPVSVPSPQQVLSHNLTTVAEQSSIHAGTSYISAPTSGFVYKSDDETTFVCDDRARNEILRVSVRRGMHAYVCAECADG